ncbi:MAG: hypothetical protein ABGX22_01755 [Pirellulaceae bacterium]
MTPDDPNPFAEIPSLASDNPYAATSMDGPASRLDDHPGSAEAIRRKHLSHEASIKSIGFLYCIGALFVFAAAILSLGSAVSMAGSVGIVELGSWLFLAAVGALQLAVGIGLRGLKAWSRIPTIIFSALGLCAVPVGTLINGYILYLVASEKGATVMTEQYRQIVEQTPHIIYKTSAIVWFLLALIIMLGLCIAGLLFAA